MTREEYKCLKESNVYKAENEKKITNQEKLSTITAEEFYDKIWWLLHEYGKRYTDSRLAIIEWLQAESEDKK